MSSGPDTDLIDEIRAELIKQADPGRAPGMQAYMKSALPYLGVPVPTVRSITRSAERQRPPDSTAGLCDAAHVRRNDRDGRLVGPRRRDFTSDRSSIGAVPGRGERDSPRVGRRVGQVAATKLDHLSDRGKANTDVALLSEAIDANAAHTDFFIRKAIGWALREYAKTDPDWVRELGE